MAKFRISQGLETNLPLEKSPGHLYVANDTGNLYLDKDDSTRIQLGTKAIRDIDGNIITETYETKTSASEKLETANKYTDSATANLMETISSNYDETILSLSVVGTTVTYIKGDGSVHSFETQDTDTTYSLGTDTVTGLTKLYATTGSAEDGTMTQKAIKTELDKKVGVIIQENMLVFTI